MAARIISIVLVVMALCVVVFSEPDSLEKMYERIFATEGTPMKANETENFIKTIGEKYRSMSRYGTTKYDEDQQKLEPFLQNRNSDTCNHLDYWQNSPYNSYVNLKSLVDIKIKSASSGCKHELQRYLNMRTDKYYEAPQTSLIWNKFKEKVNEKMKKIEKTKLSGKNIDDIFKEAFDEIYDECSASGLKHEVDRGFVEYYGASKSLADKIKDEMFAMFIYDHRQECKYVSNFDAIVANNPKDYIAGNRAERDILNRMLAYCALKDYRGKST